MCRSFRSLDRRAWAPAHGDAGLGRQLAGEDLSGRPCPRDPAMLASVVNQVPHCGFPVARSEEHTSELPVTNAHLVCRLLLEKNKNYVEIPTAQTNNNTVRNKTFLST